MGYQLLLNTNQEIKMRWDDYQKMGLFCYICLVDLVLQKLLFHSRKKQVLSKQIYLYWREVWEQQKSINSSHASLQSQKGVLRTQVCNNLNYCICTFKFSPWCVRILIPTWNSSIPIIFSRTKGENSARNETDLHSPFHFSIQTLRKKKENQNTLQPQKKSSSRMDWSNR